MELEPGTVTGTQRVCGFWDGRDPKTGRRTGGPFSREGPKYEPPPVDVRALMVECGGCRAFAERIGVKHTDVYKLVRGELRPVDGWDALVDRAQRREG